MYTFDKLNYIYQAEWMGNDYLIQPESAAKRCVTCRKVKFTIEFIDYDDPKFIDGKIPVCLTCFRSNSPSKRLKVETALRVHGIQKCCLKCAVLRDLTDYAYNKRNFGLKNNCRHCVGGIKRKEAEPIDPASLIEVAF